MSMEKKLLQAATAAANEARLREKARILWLLDVLKDDTRKGFERKLLAESERHAAMVKLALAMNVLDTVRRAVFSDLRPASDLPEDPILRKLKELDDAQD